MSAAPPSPPHSCADTRVRCRDCDAVGCSRCDGGTHPWHHCELCKVWICFDNQCGADNDCDYCKRSCCSNCMLDFTPDDVFVGITVCVECIHGMLQDKAIERRRAKRRTK